ncbi:MULTISPECIES: hypothetical protein [unclassified Curtobacterium]|uniref:hypothetical protein n=1 Tax=unclassified Curtobacterium TaxID=257496 RepID=UPI00381AFF75
MRWQAASTGAWIQRDTVDAPLSPSNANRCAFAGSDPINNSDPTGKSVAGDQVGILAGAVAGIATTATVCAFTAGVGCAAGASLGIFLGSAVGRCGVGCFDGLRWWKRCSSGQRSSRWPWKGSRGWIPASLGSPLRLGGILYINGIESDFSK